MQTPLLKTRVDALTIDGYCLYFVQHCYCWRWSSKSIRATVRIPATNASSKIALNEAFCSCGSPVNEDYSILSSNEIGLRYWPWLHQDQHRVKETSNVIVTARKPTKEIET